jgi:hypothetical protein
VTAVTAFSLLEQKEKEEKKAKESRERQRIKTERYGILLSLLSRFAIPSWIVLFNR